VGPGRYGKFGLGASLRRKTKRRESPTRKKGEPGLIRTIVLYPGNPCKGHSLGGRGDEGTSKYPQKSGVKCNFTTADGGGGGAFKERAKKKKGRY